LKLQVVSDEEISILFIKLIYGISTTPTFYVKKSGTVAAILTKYSFVCCRKWKVKGYQKPFLNLINHEI
jgi:hypothetical protein